MALETPQIHAAADRLAAEGKRPTLALVRKALGGGSFTTISEAMQTWRQQQTAEHELTTVEIPTAVEDRLQQLKAALWQAALAEAETRLAAEREALAAAREEAQAAVVEANDAVATLEAEAAEREAELAALREQLATAQTEITTLRGEAEQRDSAHREQAATLRERNQGLEARLQDAQNTINGLIEKVGKPATTKTSKRTAE